MAEQLEMCLHDGGHEFVVASGLHILRRWLPTRGEGLGEIYSPNPGIYRLFWEHSIVGGIVDALEGLCHSGISHLLALSLFLPN